MVGLLTSPIMLCFLFTIYTLLQTVWSTVTSTNTNPVFKLYQGDSLQVSIQDLFTFSQESEKVLCKEKNEQLTISDYNTPLAFQDQDPMIKGLEFRSAPLVSNQTAYILLKTKGNEMYVQNFGSDGFSLGGFIKWQLAANDSDPDGLHDAKIKSCTDLVLDKSRNYLYVLCSAIASDPPKPDADTSFVILELDPKTNSEKQRYRGSAPLNLPRLRLATLRNTNKSISERNRYLIVYDQGKDSLSSQSNKFVVVFNNTAGKPLEFIGKAEFVFQGPEFSFFSNLYEIDGYLVVSGRNFNADVQMPPSWVLRQCLLETNGTLVVNCSEKTALPVDRIEKGFVGFASSGLYVEVGGIEGQQQTVKSCSVGTWFSERNYVQRQNCQILNVDSPFNNMMIGSVYATDKLLMVNFIDYFGWHYGSAVFSLSLQKTIYKAPAYGNLSLPLDNAHVVIGPNNLTLFYHTGRYIYLKDIQAGTYTYTLQCQDSETITPVENKLTLQVVSPDVDQSTLRSLNPKKIEYPTLAAVNGSSLYWRMEYDTFIGNNNPVEVSLEDSEFLKSASLKYWANAEVVFEGPTRIEASPARTVRFAGRFAVALLDNNTLVFYECAQHLQQDETAHLSHCTEKTTRQLNNSKCELHVGASQVGPWVHFWTTDPVNKRSQTYMFASLPEIYQLGFEQGVIKSFAMSEVRSNLYFAMLFDGPIPRIESRYVRVYTYIDMMALGTIEPASSGRELFCPETLAFSQTEAHILEVVSKCTDEKTILRYEYPPQVDYNGKTDPKLLSVTKMDYYDMPPCIGLGEESVWYQKIGKFTNEYSIETRTNASALTRVRIRPPKGAKTSFDGKTSKSWLRCAPSANVFATISVEKAAESSASTVEVVVYRANRIADNTNRVLSMFSWESAAEETITKVDTYEHVGQLLISLELKKAGDIRTVRLIAYTQYVPVVLSLKQSSKSSTNLVVALKGTTAKTSVPIKIVEQPRASEPSVREKAVVVVDHNTTVHLETLLDLQRLDSHVYSAYLSPKPDKSVAVELRNRLRPFGRLSFDSPVAAPLSLLVARGDFKAGVYFNSSNKNYSSLLVFNHSGNRAEVLFNVTNSYRLSVLDMGLLGGTEPGIMVAYGFSMIGYNHIELRMIRKGLVMTYQIDRDTFVSETVKSLKLIQLDTAGQFLLLVTRHGQSQTKLYRVRTSDTQIMVDSLWDFSSRVVPTYCRPKDGQIGIIWVDPASPSAVTLRQFDRSTGEAATVKKEKDLGNFRIRRIAGSEGQEITRAGCHLAIDFEGPELTEVVFDGALEIQNRTTFVKELWNSELADSRKSHKSLRNLTSNDPLDTLLLTNDYIMITSASLWENYQSAPDLISLLVYKRNSNTSEVPSKFAYTSLPLEFITAITPDPQNSSRILLASSNPDSLNTPITLYEIQPLQLTISTPSEQQVDRLLADSSLILAHSLTDLSLTSAVDLQKLLIKHVPKVVPAPGHASKLSWVLIGAVALVVLAVVIFFVYSSRKDSQDDSEDPDSTSFYANGSMIEPKRKQSASASGS